MPIQLSGSLVITGSITTTGVITMSGSIASASYSSTSDLLQGTGSVGFATTASFNAVSSSQQQISASYIALSGSYNVFSGSASTRITVDSASLLQVSASYIALSASYNTFSGSSSTRITANSSSIQQVSSSQQQISASLLNVIAIGATTGSNSFRANQSITGSLVVSSTITAQTLIVQTVTSSIVYSSGSNIFGSALGDRQTFTGSVNITGSVAIVSAATYALDVTGAGRITSNVLVGNTGSASSVWNKTLQVYDATAAALSVRTGVADWHIGTNNSGDLFHYNNTNSTHTLTIASTGAATFTNTETTFNYNPQTNLLASYNYINFGGGSIMYRNATDIYIGSNAKYGSAGTVVAGYTSLYGMGLLTMDAGTLNYQANNTSVTAGTAYGVPIRFTIKGDGNVGIGASSPCGKLQVVLPAYTNEDTDSQQAIFGSCTNGYGVRIGYNESCNAGYINSLKPAVAWSKLSLQGSSIVFAPTSTERVRVTTDGLTFNGDTAAANALDDYEEGDLTLGFAFGGACVGMTTSINCGKYTKIGRQVSITGAIVLTCKGSSTGDATVYGLPYLIGNTNGHYSSAAFRNGDICFTGQFVGYGAINSSYIVLNQMSNAGVLSGINNNNFINASTMLISFTYFT